MLDSEKNIKNKGKVTLESFWNFVYIWKYVHLISFAWKRGSPIFSELQISLSWICSRKLSSSTSYIQIENTETTTLFFEGSWILPYFWDSSWHYFGYISGKVAKPHFLEKHRSISKNAKIHVNKATHYKITALKIWKIYDFWRLLFQKINCWHFHWTECLIFVKFENIGH